MQSAQIRGTWYGLREAFDLLGHRLFPRDWVGYFDDNGRRAHCEAEARDGDAANREAEAGDREASKRKAETESRLREIMDHFAVPALLIDPPPGKKCQVAPEDWQAHRSFIDNSPRLLLNPSSGLARYQDKWPCKDGELRIKRAPFDQALDEMFGQFIPEPPGKLQRGAPPRLDKVIAWLKDRIETWPDDVPAATEGQDLEAARGALGDVRRAQLRAAVKALHVSQSWRKPGPRSLRTNPAE